MGFISMFPSCLPKRSAHHPFRWLDDITPYANTWRVLVKVDRSYPRTDMNRIDSGYPMRVLSFDFIVFDEKDTRMMIRLAGDDMIDRFANVLKDGGVFFVKNFLVADGGERIHDKYHIVLLPTTIIQEYNIQAPDHCFKLKDVRDLRKDYYHGCCVADVCGLLCSPVDFKWVRDGRVVYPQLKFVVEDRLMDRVSVMLVGNSALDGWHGYAQVKHIENPVVIVQFGSVKKDGDEVSLESHASATRAFWNPTFNEIVSARRELLARIWRG